MVTVFVLICYVVMILNWLGIVRMQMFNISLSSVIIVLMYLLSIRYLSAEDGSTEEEETVSR